ncbi:unnamed protein product [Arctogadus glacialis]
MADLLLPPHEAGRKPDLRASHFQFTRAKQVSTSLTEKKKREQKKKRKRKRNAFPGSSLSSVCESARTRSPRDEAATGPGSKRGSAGDQGIRHPANIRVRFSLASLCLPSLRPVGVLVVLLIFA